ncbi:phage protein NinX family protein [Pseudomonas syringae]|uniref:phage protein NinX family protein n=1 Tax=Pseudomonas syringae TaxID=317 RepID=UPI000A1FB64A|nr:phage protein NinX family protein [Pseudomonas syringae]OSN39539.1 hypothetical protein BV342_01250 [Pseudomonas syringae pv. actinidiae]OSR62614.1 hypothetical protein BV325_01652 [Pseudomonas syringae pv. actinidiae]OSR79941.1 hypothetical protein BV328_01638 [Pseudomonas syringae pv. actinidiae]
MTDPIEMNTADLTGEALNWSVAKALGLNAYLAEPHYMNPHRVMIRYTPDGCHFEQQKRFQPSTDWAQGGPLLEKRKILTGWIGDQPIAFTRNHKYQDGVAVAPTPLIAICRAIVASVLGDTVSVPKELLS